MIPETKSEFCFNRNWNDYLKMNKIVNKFRLAGDKFMPKLHFKTARIYLQCLWTVYTYFTCLDYFGHDVACSDNKDVVEITISEKILKDRAYEITINPKYNKYQKG